MESNSSSIYIRTIIQCTIYSFIIKCEPDVIDLEGTYRSYSITALKHDHTVYYITLSAEINFTVLVYRTVRTPATTAVALNKVDTSLDT